jgi:hypothetical protein
VPHWFYFAQVAAGALLCAHEVRQRVAHQENWEVLFLLEHLLFLVDQRFHERFFVEIVCHAHMRVACEVNSVQLLVKRDSLGVRHAIVNGNYAETSLLKELHMRFRNVACLLLVATLDLATHRLGQHADHWSLCHVDISTVHKCVSHKL